MILYYLAKDHKKTIPFDLKQKVRRRRSIALSGIRLAGGGFLKKADGSFVFKSGS